MIYFLLFSQKPLIHNRLRIAHALFLTEMNSSTLLLYPQKKSHEQVVRRRSNIGFKIGGLNFVHCVGCNFTPTTLFFLHVFYRKQKLHVFYRKDRSLLEDYCVENSDF